MYKYILNIIFFLLINYITLAQTTKKIEHFTINQGLSQTTVTCIFQSSDGIIWIGTQDGLNFFDGYNFTIIKKNNKDTNSISNNYINDICEGNNGDIIIATQKGITVWNRKENIFKRINIVEDKFTSLNNNINQVVYSSGTIWALTKNKLIKINKNSIKKYNYAVDTSIFSASENIDLYNLTNLIIDKNKNLWFATPAGLKTFYPKSERLLKIYDNSNIHFTNTKAQYILEKSNSFWIGTSSGLNEFNKKTGTFDSIYYYNNDSSYIKENTINNIFIDTNNTFWLGTNKGIKTFDGNKICDFNNDEINSIKTEITSIFKDNSNNIWIGTRYSGIYRISLDKKKFKSFTDLPNQNKYVFAIHIDKKEQIWLGTKGLVI
ncbi:MAG: two-component regulator propeller domain-containing protein, partial [Bacteroidota bacterium]|nr:two-component regulator propeller domain-containing protein [Bacteroidota bacterium]